MKPNDNVFTPRTGNHRLIIKFIENTKRALDLTCCFSILYLVNDRRLSVSIYRVKTQQQRIHTPHRQSRVN